MMNSASQAISGDKRGATLSRESTASHSSGVFKVVIGLSLGCVAVAGCILLGSSSTPVDHVPKGSVKHPRSDRTRLPETPAMTPVATHPAVVQQQPALHDPLPRPEKTFHPLAASLAPLPVTDMPTSPMSSGIVTGIWMRFASVVRTGLVVPFDFQAPTFSADHDEVQCAEYLRDPNLSGMRVCPIVFASTEKRWMFKAGYHTPL
jgi:hypothetical protein